MGKAKLNDSFQANSDGRHYVADVKIIIASIAQSYLKGVTWEILQQRHLRTEFLSGGEKTSCLFIQT